MGTHSRKTPADVNLAMRIELSMRRAGLSQVKLAEKVSRSPGAISHWLKARYEPPRGIIPALTDALGVSVEWLMGTNLTAEQREREKRLLRLVLYGGDELDRLLQKVDPEELLELLTRHAQAKGRGKSLKTKG